MITLLKEMRKTLGTMVSIANFVQFLPEEFEQFLSDTGLVSEDVETMGSLGAPGFGMGWAPAISFNGDSMYECVIQNAYVTPIPMAKTVKDLETYDYELTERDWQRIRDLIVKKYQYGV